MLCKVKKIFLKTQNENPDLGSNIGKIGLLLHKNWKNQCEITGIKSNSSADKCGMIKIGDILISVDGKNINESSILDIQNMIIGKSNTSVRLELQRHYRESFIKINLIRKE